VQELPTEEDENRESVLDAERTGARAASQNGLVASIVLTDWTTRVAICREGQVIDTAVFMLGAKTLQISDDNRMLSISDDGETFIDAVRKKIREGDQVDTETVELLSNLMGETIVQGIARRRFPQISMRLLQGEPLRQFYDVRDFRVARMCSPNRMASLLFKSVQDSLTEREYRCQAVEV
jgi:ethanolamine utilization protein EutA (predicted chaperonin)